MDIEKYRQLLGSLKDAFGVQRADVTAMEAPSGDGVTLGGTAPVAEMADTTRARLLKELNEAITQAGLSDKVTTEIHDRGVLVKITGEIMFASGSAQIRGSFHPLLREIAHIISHFEYPVIIEGHTDDRPINTTQFPSNWELSSARAGAIVRLLTQSAKIKADRFTAVGYADTRPLVSNISESNRMKNRRVNFLFINDGTNNVEVRK